MPPQRALLISLVVVFVGGLAFALCNRFTVMAGEPVQPKRLTREIGFKQRPVWSPDGRTVCYARHEGSNIWLWLLDTESLTTRRLTKREFPEYDASFSADGKRLVFCCVTYSGGQGNVDLCTLGIETGESKHLIGDQGKLSHEESPAWSPDGKRVAFTSTRDDNQEVYIIDSDGQNAKRLTNDPAIDAHPVWAPDGKRILFATNRWGNLEIASVDIENNTVQRLTSSNGLDDYPACSADGKWIAFASLRSGDFDVWVMPLTGGEPTNFSRDPGFDNFPTWTPKGDLCWVSNRDGEFQLYLLNASTSADNKVQ